MHWSIGTPKYEFQQSNGCTETQRDQLRAQVEQANLENGRLKVRVAHVENELEAKDAQVEQWKAYAERLEEAGLYMASQSTREDANRWQKAKETKP